MSIEKVDKALRIIWNLDDDGNKVSIPISNESHVVVNGKITLLEIPDVFYGVQVKDNTTNLQEINTTDSETEITDNKFRVHYGLGIIFFHQNMEGKTLNINYSSRGSIMYPASRIYTDVNEVDGSLTNLQDVVNDVKKASTDLQNLGNTVSEGQRLESVLTTLNEESQQNYKELNTSINTAENIKQELNTVTTNADNKKTELTQEISIANSSYTSLHDEISRADAFMDAKKNEVESDINDYTKNKKNEISDFVGENANPAHGTIKKGIKDYANDYTNLKKTELEDYTNDTLKVELNTYKDQKIEQFNTSADEKKSSIQSALDAYKDDKKTQLSSHTQQLKNSMDAHKDTKLTEITNHTNSKKQEISDFVGNSVDPVDGTVKKDINDFVKTKETRLDNHTSNKETQLNQYANNLKEDMNAFKSEKNKEIDAYVTNHLKTHTEAKQIELDDYTKNKKKELDGRLAEADSKICDLSGSISTATTKKSDLDKVISTSNEKHTTLQGDINQANGKIAEIDDLNQRVSVYEDFSSNTTYYPQNKVLYQGNTYLVLKEIAGIIPVDDDVNYRLIVQGVKSNDAINIKTDSTHRFITDSERLKWNDTYRRNEVENKITQAVKQIDWKEAVQKFEDLIKTYPDAEEGWTASVNNEDKVYRYDGTDWRQISGSEIPLATHVLDGKMSAIDKTKIDGIEYNANNYTHPANHSANIITQDATHRFVTDTEKSNWNNKAENNHSHLELHSHSNITVLNELTDDEGNLKYKGKSIGNSKVMYFTKSGTLTPESNQIPIGIQEFNEGNDFLVVTIGGIIKTKDTEYTIVDGNKIQKIDDGTGANWDNGTQYDFICMKSVEIKDEELQDGTLIQDGTIAKTKLNEEVKGLLEHSNADVLNQLTDSAGKLKYKGKPIIPEEKSRTIHVATDEPADSDGEDGDIWIVYQD